MTLAYFDAYCAFGPLSAPPFGQEFATAEALLAAMDDADIAEALVFSTLAWELDAVTGNMHLMQSVRGHNRLHPCWVVMPHHTGEMPPPDELIPMLRQQGVRAVRVFPGADGHNFSLSAWSCGPLLTALAQAQVPLFLNLISAPWSTPVAVGWDPVAAFEVVASLLASYPGLPLVLTGVNFRSDRYLYPLWEAYPNLFVEISGDQGQQAIEAVVRRFGPERLLFGTSMPRFSAGATIANLAYANIPAAAKDLIAGGNLRRLLGAAYGNR